MCGRFACFLEPGVIQKACTYYDPEKKIYKQPDWREHPAAGDPEAAKSFLYHPSANMAPTQFSPVMFRSEEDRVLQPMMWGIIPPWHTGSPKSHKYSTINARIEGLERSRLFKRAINGRQFCAVVAQGFYEWKEGEKAKGRGAKQKAPKQPYFLCMKQDKMFTSDDVADEEAWKRGTWSENEGWNGPKIIYMAGLYDIWHSPQGEMVCSFTIITGDTSEEFKWLHPRLPFILETPEQLEAWLNPDPQEDVTKHLSILKPATALDFHPVHPKVNDAKCRDQDCAKRYEPKEAQTKIDTILPPKKEEEQAKKEEVVKEEKPVEEPKKEEMVQEGKIEEQAKKEEMAMEEGKPQEETKVEEPLPMEVTEEKEKAEEVRKEMAEKAMEEVLGEKPIGGKKEAPTGKENVDQQVMSKTAEDIDTSKAKPKQERKRRASSEELHIQATRKRQVRTVGKKVTAA